MLRTHQTPRIPSSAHLPDASPAWGLILQSGVLIHCTVGLPLNTLLRDEFGLGPDLLRRIDVALLNGQPVDDRDDALVPDGARLALAAGLPGIAGLAMKSGSAVRALRGGITHAAGPAPSSPPRAGRISLALFSLALSLLDGHFLARGVLVLPDQFIRYAALAPGDPCVADGRTLTAAALAAEMSTGARQAEPEGAYFRLTAVLRA